VPRDTAKQFVERWHYSHKLSLCQVAYGLFYDTKSPSLFFDNTKIKLIGVVVYSQPAGRSAAESISDLIKVEECMELIRLVILDDYGKNIESYFISQSLKCIKKEFPNTKAIISYADGEQGHKGTIYQACGFHYQGNSTIALMPNYSMSLEKPYKWLHSRTVSSTYGSHNVEHLKKKIGHTFWRKKESSKHRYVYLLGNKVEKKKILKNLKHPFLPYPKEAHHQDEIEEVVVENSEESRFFD
jgi:hypothetical protein